MPSSLCPRCRALVSYGHGVRPSCPACGYPGPDPRDWPSGPAAVPGAGEGVRRPSDGKRVAALVTGICSLFVFPLAVPLGVTALVLGLRASREARRVGRDGGAMATWGIILGAAGALLGLPSLLFFVLALFLAGR